MPGLTDKRADPAANGPSFPVEGEQPTEPAFDLAEPINQIYEFGEFSFEMEFLVDGAPLVRTERAEPWLSDPDESKFDLRPEGSVSVESGDIDNRAAAIFREDTLFFREDDPSG
jgi:hypothetical protein